jgi:hypothetical protein
MEFNANFVPELKKPPFQLKNNAYRQRLRQYGKRFSADDSICRNSIRIMDHRIFGARNRGVRQIFDGYLLLIIKEICHKVIAS